LQSALEVFSHSSRAWSKQEEKVCLKKLRQRACLPPARWCEGQCEGRFKPTAEQSTAVGSCHGRKDIQEAQIWYVRRRMKGVYVVYYCKLHQHLRMGAHPRITRSLTRSFAGMKQRSLRTGSLFISFLVCLGLCCGQTTGPPAGRTADKPAAAASSTAVECGKPGSPCGADIPAGFTCPKGPGWCQPGYYCGKQGTSSSGVSLCRPVPANCGKAGKPCCPSNAKTHHTSSTNKDDRLPFCTNGSLCYYSIEPLSMINDVYTGVASESCFSSVNALLLLLLLCSNCQ
jgi:hypothetical protein